MRESVTSAAAAAPKGNAKLLPGGGDGVLVFSHGFGCNQSFWEQLLPHLLSEYSVLVYDLQGHGRNTCVDDELLQGKYRSIQGFADDLLEILELLTIKKCVYVGHSVSGMVGCLASVARPELFERIILLGASARYLNDSGYAGGFDEEEVEHILLSIQQDYVSWAEGFVPRILGPEASAEAVEQYTSSFQAMDPRVAYAVAKAIFRSDYRSFLCKVRVPCHLIQTKSDLAVPYEAAEYLHRELGAKEKTLDVVDTEGHLPHLTAPHLLLPFLKKLLALSSR